jgi:hypothetical protein
MKRTKVCPSASLLAMFFSKTMMRSTTRKY